MNLAIILFAGAVVVLLWLYLWTRQRGALMNAPEVDDLMREMPLIAPGDAFLVTNAHGRLLHANEVIHDWLDQQAITLESAARFADPVDTFLNLFTQEAQASFQLNGRWVEASSHRVNPEGEERVVVILRDLRGGGGDTLDLAKAIRVINEIGATVNVSLGVAPTLQSLLEIIRRSLPADAGEINLWDDSSKVMIPRGWVGDTAYVLQLVEVGGAYAVSDENTSGITGFIARYKQPVLVTDKNEPMQQHPLLDFTAFNSYIGVPLMLNDEVIGTLEFAAARAFTPGDLALLQAVEKQVTTAIYNAQLYTEQARRVEDFATLQRDLDTVESDPEAVFTALNARIARLLDVEICGVLVYDERRQRLNAQPPFHGLPTHIVRSYNISVTPGSEAREIFMQRDQWISVDATDEPLADALNLSLLVNAAGVRNTLMMPLIVGGRRVGMIQVCNKRAVGGFTERDAQNLRLLSAQAATLVEDIRLTERERVRNAEMEGLQEIAQAFGALGRSEELLTSINERLARLMNVEICGVLLYNTSAQRLSAQPPFYGLHDDAIRFYHVELGDDNTMAQLWREDEYWYTNNAQTDKVIFGAGLADFVALVNIRQTLFVPLSSGGQRLGALQVANKRDNTDFTDADARLLTIFAAQVGALIENSRLFREVRQRAEEAEGLRRVAEYAGAIMSAEDDFLPALREVARLTSSTGAFLNLLEPQTGNLVMYPRYMYGLQVPEMFVLDAYSRGFEYSVTISRRPFYSHDLPNDTRTLNVYHALSDQLHATTVCLVPLVVGDQTLGELGVVNRTDPPYSEADVMKLQAIAIHIAAALDRIRLTETTGENLRRRLQELDAISRVSNELAVTLDLDRVLDVIRHEAVRATEAEGNTVVLVTPREQWRSPDEPRVERRLGEQFSGTGLAPVEHAAVQSGTTALMLDDYSLQEEYAPQPSHARSALAAAFTYEDQVVGIIHLYHSQPFHFDERAAAFLETLAAKASVSYANHRLYLENQERSERLARRVEQLNQIFELGQLLQSNVDTLSMLEAIAFSVQQSIGFDIVMMLMVEDLPEGQQVLRRVTQAGLPVDAFEEGKDDLLSIEALETLFANDAFRVSESYFLPINQMSQWYVDGLDVLSAGFAVTRTLHPRGREDWHDGDMLIVPLMAAGGGLLGVMSLDRPFDDKRPDRAKIEILEIFAHQAAATIENNRLYTTAARSAEQQARLNEVMEAIASTLDTSDIVEAVARGVMRLLPFARMHVALLDPEQQGFDLIRVTVTADGTLSVGRDRRPTLTHTGMGRTFESGVDYLYHADDPEVDELDDLRGWRSEGERTALIVPLVTGGLVLGALHIGSDRENALGFSDFRPLIKRIANLTAVAVQNARLFNQAVNLRLFTESVVESIQQGIIVLDRSGRIVAINDYMRQRNNLRGSVERRDVFDVLPALRERLAAPLVEILDGGSPREFINQRVRENAQERVQNFYLYPLRAAEGTRGAVLLIEDATERAQLEADIAARAERLALLNRVSISLAQSLDIENVMEIALTEIAQALHIERARAYFFERDINLARVVVERPRGDEQPNVAFDLRSRIIMQNMIHNPEVLFIPDISEFKGGQALLNELTDLPRDGYIAIPMTVAGQVSGMFEFDIVGRVAPLQADQFELAQTIANQAAIALQNANLLEQSLIRTRELETLFEAAQSTSYTLDLDEVYQSVARLVMQALDVDDVMVMLYDNVEETLRVELDANRFDDETRITPRGTVYDLRRHTAKQRALRAGQITVLRIDSQDIDPLERDEMAVSSNNQRLLVPLIVREQPLGMIQVELQDLRRGFTHRDVRMAQALGAQAGTAIENARLNTQTAELVEQSLAINDISRIITSTMDIAEMIAVLREQMPNLTDAEEIFVALYDPESEELFFPLALRDGKQLDMSNRELGADEFSYVIRTRRVVTMGGDNPSAAEVRRNLRIVSDVDSTRFLGVPLVASEAVVGVLAVRDTKQTRPFGLNDNRILTTIGAQLSAALQNAQLFERVSNFAEELNVRIEERTRELAEERDRLDALYRITAEVGRTLDTDYVLRQSLTMMAAAVRADDGLVYMIDPLTDRLQPRTRLITAVSPDANGDSEPDHTHPASMFANWLMAHNERAARIDDLRGAVFWDMSVPGADRYLSAVGAVLETNEDIQGVILLLGHEHGQFNDEALKLVMAAASQVASSVNNADLVNLIRDQNDRMSLMLRTEQEEAEKNSAILEGIADGVMLADANGAIVLFNGAAEQIVGLTRDYVLGQPLARLAELGEFGSQEGTAQWVNMVDRWIANPQTSGGEVAADLLELGEKVVSVRATPVYSGDQFLGVVSVFRDVTRDVELDRMKSEFISNVSHELRTPMTSIKGYADLLIGGAAGDINDGQRRFLNTIKNNADRLTVLVNEILNISRLDSGRDQLKLETVDLGELTEQVVENVRGRTQFERKHLDVHLHIADDLPTIRADRFKVIQVISNIVDNAFNYTYPGGKIDVSVGIDPTHTHRVLIKVTDTGVGIPENFRDRVWNRFERYEENALVLDVAGTGLGLSIVKTLVEQHDGAVWFESEVNVGTTFFIALPISGPSGVTTSSLPSLADTNPVEG